jgi:hypothetical protein
MILRCRKAICDAIKVEACMNVVELRQADSQSMANFVINTSAASASASLVTLEALPSVRIVHGYPPLECAQMA